MNTKRKDNETIKDYKIRLFRNKVLYGITSKDIASLINKETGDDLSETSYRKWFKPYEEGFSDGKNSISQNMIDEANIKERIKLQKEKVKLNDEKNAHKATLRKEARSEYNVNTMKDILSKIIPYEATEIIPVESSDNDLLIGLNDIHYGVLIDNHWNKYSPEIAKERLDKYLNYISGIKNLHKSENCYVCANGDLISGNIHTKITIANRDDIITQTMQVADLVAYFLKRLSELNFNNVYFAVVAGNHSRTTQNKDESPTNERLDRMIPWYIRAKLSEIKNVQVIDDSVDCTYNTIKIRDKVYLNVHGDYDKSQNNLSSIIEMSGEDVYCVHMGHLHHNFTNWMGKIKVIMSGSLMGMDDLCVTHRIIGKAQQLVCVCTKDGITATYDVDLQ